MCEQQVQKLLQQEQEKLETINSLRRQLLQVQYQQELQRAQHARGAAWKEAEECNPLQAMDFEQLKMENQTLNERLVERQEEAQKLLAITRNSAQVRNNKTGLAMRSTGK